MAYHSYQSTDYREAAETLLQSGAHNVNTSPPDMSHSYSINTVQSLHPDYVVSEDLLAGLRAEGRMSSVRRFFCLFVTFDLTLTVLMWIICIMLKGENIMTALNEQIIHYSIHTSLFDVVMVALCRFICLLLFYAIIYMNHWIVILFSTGFTCVFLLVKVFYYYWTHSSQPVFEVLLVITSFVVSWGEAWFLDFRVIPQELQSRRYLITNRDSERAPLIQRYMAQLPSQYTESIANFYSPRSSPDGSMRYNPAPVLGRYLRASLTFEQVEEYKKAAANVMQKSWDLLHDPDWKEVKTSEGNTVCTMNLTGENNKKKIYKLKTVFDINAKVLMEELFYRVEHMTSWDKSLEESHKIHVFDEYTDIIYQISAANSSGLITSRDFVNLRKWGLIDDHYVIAFTAADYPTLPKQDKYIRGENGASCWAIQVDQDNFNSCTLYWILNINLKGWIPQYLLDTALTDVMFVFMKNLRNHVGSLKQR